MVFWGAIAVAVVLIASIAYLELRILATGIAAPKGDRELLPNAGDDRPWLEGLGFRTVGELLFPAAEKNAPPAPVPALVDVSGTILATVRPLQGDQIALLTTWPDGATVLTRCPRRAPFTSRDSAGFLYRSGATASEAISLHRQAVLKLANGHGRPVQASRVDAIAECYRAAARTWRRQLLRSYALSAPLGMLALAALVVAVLAR
jgi:hypothetical protein